jgi:hypothetical protein
LRRAKTNHPQVLDEEKPGTRPTPYALPSHIANGIGATYRVKGGLTVVCGFNQYDV